MRHAKEFFKAKCNAAHRSDAAGKSWGKLLEKEDRPLKNLPRHQAEAEFRLTGHDHLQKNLHYTSKA